MNKIILALLCFLLFGAPLARAESPFKFTGTGGIITRPVGLYIRHDLGLKTGILPKLFGPGFLGDLEVGVFHNYFFYSNEFGVQFAWQTDPALLRLSLDAAVEPGGFIQVKNGEFDEEGEREFGLRKILRGIALINLKLDSFWFYSRSTALLRQRNFIERDIFQDITLETEVSFEQATAFFLPITALPAWRTVDDQSPRLWGYAEYTVGVLLEQDVRPNRVSVGLVTENFPAPYIGLNLDVFYSFAEAPTRGPGAIFVYGFAF